MKLPSESTWNIFKGTWFVYTEDELTIHIQLKNNGMQNVYVNNELTSSIRTFKLKSSQEFSVGDYEFQIRIYPNNRALTSFSTELVINDELKKIFTFAYERKIRNYVPMLLMVILLTVPMTLLEAPSWSFYVMVLLVPIIKIVFFNKNMFVIEERDNPANISV